MRNKAVRLANLFRLIDEAGSITKLAERCGTPASHISNIKNRVTTNGKVREIGDALALKLERGMGKPDGWMDRDHEDVRLGEFDPETLLFAREFQDLSPPRRAFVQTQLGLAKTLNFGDIHQSEEQ